MGKKFLSVLFAAALMFTSSPVLAADWYPEHEYDPAKFKVMLQEGRPFLNFSMVTSNLFPTETAKENWKGILGQYHCKTLVKNPCILSPRTDVSARMVAPLCSGSEVNCIREFFAVTPSGKVKAKFLGYQNPQTVPANPRLGIRGRGKSTSLWNIPGVLNSAGTSTYAVTVSYYLTQRTTTMGIGSFRTNITPYAEQPDERAENIKVYSYKKDGLPWVTWDGPVEGCAWVKKSVCGRAVEFGTGSRFGLDLRFENQFTNWFGGRMTDIDLSVKELPNDSKSIRIIAAPVEVPIFSFSLPRESTLSKLKKIDGFETDSWIRGLWLDSDSESAMQVLDQFRSEANDTAASTMKFWSFSNISWGSATACASDPYQILGLVSTNAMAYQPDPPKFKAGFLNYEVSGLHMLPGGETTLGSYDLLIRSSVASCLYGFGSAPLSASVSVVNDQGGETFATTTFGQKDGWLKLSAKGFTFSKKTIKVKITKAKR
jgi:hypothetical protein